MPGKPETQAPRERCAGKTARGKPCSNLALPGRRFCRMHIPLDNRGASGSAAFQGPTGQGAGNEEMLLLLRQILETLVELQRIQAQAHGLPQADEQLRRVADQICEFAAQKGEFLKRRVQGEYEVDEWGYDPEVLKEIMPVLRFMYRTYWRVTVSGIENIPSEGRALMVANHSGVVPWDATMICAAVLEDHPARRVVRGLHLSWATELPFVGTLMHRIGHVQALPENAERLLNQDELVLVFPEGLKGIGKPYSERYQLARFGRGGFVRVAINTKASMIPVSVVGAEEIHPLICNLKPLAALFGAPYIPVTPTFPLLGLLGLIPFPTKWHIHFDKPIPIPDVEPAREPMLVSKLTLRVRETIQHNIYAILKTRRSVFF
jgi:1-acyl-sn-glycerol-3-phosphate acyltransferase